MSAAESAGGGSLSAMSPASFRDVGGPQTTASTLKPWPSSSANAVAAVGEGWASPLTAAKAPFTTRCVAPLESVTDAADIFVAGSNGVKVFRCHATGEVPSERLLLVAAERMAASTGSCPPSELASAANTSTFASVKPDIGRTVLTDSSLRVSVPVLSAHKTSIDADSSTAERRVGRTPSFASARAPNAAARVNVAGNATGIEASTPVRTRGIISVTGILRNQA